MLIDFFYALRDAGLKPGPRELLTLLEALDRRVVGPSLDDFYYLARATLVKDETLFDRFDRVFGACFRGAAWNVEDLIRELPRDWLISQMERLFSEEEKARLRALDWQTLMDTLKQRLAEQQERHEGGSKWIGTGGTSPFGANGYNPAGVRIGQEKSNHRRAVKVWDKREFSGLDDSVELGTRNLKLALRKLRRFAREGAAEMLDLPATIGATARNAGHLDLRFVPEPHNAVKVLLLLDIGGSMDDHVRVCEELFSAVRAEFKHLEHFYFHNCVYEHVWRDDLRRGREATPTLDLLHKYDQGYKLIVVGDASMSPYELLYPGSSVEHHNAESGEVWLKRLFAAYPSHVWLNPVQPQHWDYTHTIRLVRDLVMERMFPLTVAGLDEAITALQRRR